MRKRSTGLLPFSAESEGERVICPDRAGSEGIEIDAPKAGSVAPQGVCSWRAHSRAPPRLVKPKPPKGGGHFSRKSHSLRQDNV